MKDCKGGKQSKQWITVTFIVNAAGASESKPIVIWKSDKPRCFKKVNKSQLPVQYFSQKKAWMTGGILDQVLSKINGTLRMNGHSVLLLMDNAGCHPEELQRKYTNIKIVYLPAIQHQFFSHLIWELSRISKCGIGSSFSDMS